MANWQASREIFSKVICRLQHTEKARINRQCHSLFCSTVTGIQISVSSFRGQYVFEFWVTHKKICPSKTEVLLSYSSSRLSLTQVKLPGIVFYKGYSHLRR